MTKCLVLPAETYRVEGVPGWYPVCSATGQFLDRVEDASDSSPVCSATGQFLDRVEDASDSSPVCSATGQFLDRVEDASDSSPVCSATGQFLDRVEDASDSSPVCCATGQFLDRVVTLPAWFLCAAPQVAFFTECRTYLVWLAPFFRGSSSEHLSGDTAAEHDLAHWGTCASKCLQICREDGRLRQHLQD